MKENPLKYKSEDFADRIVKLYKYLQENKEFVMSKQILKSGTSIGANVAEANYASSEKDFINKLQIAAKECAETGYWLGRLRNGDFITKQQFDSLDKDLKEIGKILTSSLNTSKNNNSSA